MLHIAFNCNTLHSYEGTVQLYILSYGLLSHYFSPFAPLYESILKYCAYIINSALMHYCSYLLRKKTSIMADRRRKHAGGALPMHSSPFNSRCLGQEACSQTYQGPLQVNYWLFPQDMTCNSCLTPQDNLKIFTFQSLKKNKAKTKYLQAQYRTYMYYIRPRKVKLE